MKKILLYIFIGIPLLGLLLWGIFMAYLYFSLNSHLPRNTDIQEAHTPEDKYNVYLQTGNNLYTQSTGTGVNLDQKIPLLEESVNNYSDALSLFSNEYAAKNLEFVQEQLRITKLEQQKQQAEQNKEKQDSQEQEGESQKGKDKESGKKSGKQNGESQNSKKQEGKQGENKETGKKSENGKEGEKSKSGAKDTANQGKNGKEAGEGKKGEDTNKSSSQSYPEGEKKTQKKGLSEETRKILEKKAKELEKQQGDIGQFYNKNYKENNSRSPFDNFADIFGKDPFFDNSLLNENEEKDW